MNGVEGLRVAEQGELLESALDALAEGCQLGKSAGFGFRLRPAG